MGEQPASIIAKHGQLSRSSCYQSLSNLAGQGYISQIIRDGTTFFAITNLHALLDRLKLQKRQEIAQITLLKKNDLSPSGSGHFLNTRRPRAHYFGSTAGIRTLLLELLQEKPGQIKIYLGKKSYLRDPLDSHDYLQHLAQRHILLEILSSQNSPEPELAPKNWRWKNLPGIFDCGLDLIITSHQLIVLSQVEQFGLRITSSHIASASGRFFAFIWKLGHR